MLKTLSATYFVILFVLIWGLSSDGIVSRISDDYWPVAIPSAIVIGILFAWGVQRSLIGRRYKPRSGPELTFGLSDSWTLALISTAILVMFATLDLAHVMNRIVGIPYASRYGVAGKYVYRGKSTCYGLILVNTDELTDRLKMCISSAQQDAISTQDVLQVSGRRSWFGSNVLSYAVERRNTQ